MVLQRVALLPGPSERGAPPGRCTGCFVKQDFCLCDRIPRLENRVRIVLLRHAAEVFRPSNSGRLAHRALGRSAVYEYGVPGVAGDDGVLREPGTWLLFTGGAELTAPPDPLPRQLVVLDGSWSQARRMSQRIGALRGLPRLTLPPPAVVPRRLRRAADPQWRSTLEAVAAALGLLEGRHLEAPLLELFTLFVRRSLLASGVRRQPPGTRLADLS